jgi:hypothetical protein
LAVAFFATFLFAAGFFVRLFACFFGPSAASFFGFAMLTIQ